VQPGRARVGLGVVDVDARAAKPGQQQEAALQAVLAHVVALVHQGAGAGVPPEVVQLVPAGGQLGPADDLRVVRRRLVDVDDAEGVGLLTGAVERDNVGQLLGRRRDRLCGAAVERRVHRRGRHAVVIRTCCNAHRCPLLDFMERVFRSSYYQASPVVHRPHLLHGVGGENSTAPVPGQAQQYP